MRKKKNTSKILSSFCLWWHY